MPEIKHYAIRFHGGPQGSGSGIRTQIHLFDDKNRMVGAVDFYEQGHSLPIDSKQDQLIRLSLPSDQAFAIIDMLRNEKPIFLEWQERLQNGYLGTSQEPVGEGE
ncbi:MAG: hypothetical protein AAF399_15025 [Bacteroidota bacterium]